MSQVPTFQIRVIKGSIITIFLTIFGSVFAYLIRILYSRTMTIEDYGLFYAVVGLFGMVTAYNNLGFGYSVTYLLPKYIKVKDYAKAWNIYIYSQAIALIMTVVISLFLIIFAPYLSQNYFKLPGAENLIYIFCIYAFASTLLNGLIQVYSGMQKEMYYTSITVFRWLLTLIFSFLLFFFNSPNIIFYALSWAIGHTLTVMIFLYFLHHKHIYLAGNKISWDSKVFKTMKAFAFPALLESMISFFVIMTDTTFLTIARGVREVGIYNIIFPLTSISVIILNPLNTLLLPLTSHLMEGERDKIKYLLSAILKIFPFIGVYFSLFLIMFPTSIVELFFGQKWLGLVETPLFILAISFIIVPLTDILGAIVLGTGKVVERLKILSLISIVYVALNLFFIWKYGIIGAAITKGLIALLSIIAFLYIVRSVISINIPWMFYIKLILSSCLIYAVIKIISLSPVNLFELITVGIVYSLFFMILGYLLKVVDASVLKEFNLSFLKQRLNRTE